MSSPLTRAQPSSMRAALSSSMRKNNSNLRASLLSGYNDSSKFVSWWSPRTLPAAVLTPRAMNNMAVAEASSVDDKNLLIVDYARRCQPVLQFNLYVEVSCEGHGRVPLVCPLTRALEVDDWPGSCRSLIRYNEIIHFPYIGAMLVPAFS